MRILLLGAGGFIGRHILAELLGHGHEVVAVVRRAHGLDVAFPSATILPIDLAGATDEADWRPRLTGIDVVVNAAGLLRGRDIEAVHVAMPQALHRACAAAGVRRVVLISAISARPEVETNYAGTKLRGEDALRATALEWTILRPSLVYGDGSYGGTSLLRGMAGLPGFVPVPGQGDFAFTPIHARDLAHAVRVVCESETFIGRTLEPAGPDTLTLKDLLSRYRAWLGFGSTRFLPVPMPVMRALAWLGDRAGTGPISRNSLVQMIAGNAGNGGLFADAIGFRPRSLDEALRERPAQVQDRWHSRLFFLAPALKTVLATLWIASAALGLSHGAAQTSTVIGRIGVPEQWAAPLQIGASIIDLAVAALVIFDRRARWSTVVQLAVVLGYTAVIGIAWPELWLDPLGPLLKNLPILVAILVHGAIGDRR